MNIEKLEKLLDEIFIHNYISYENRSVSPLNAEDVKADMIRGSETKRKNNKEICDSLVEVVKSIQSEGGISKEMYKENKYAINTFARKQTGLLNYGGFDSEYDSFIEIQDRGGISVTPSQVARFPKDTTRDQEFSNLNIFSEMNRFSHWEGTLFQTEYNEEGNLVKYRLFHQGHRHRLKVRTVGIEKLKNEIKKYVKNYSDEVSNIEFGLTLSKKQFLEKINEFNDCFGKYMELLVEHGAYGYDIYSVFNQNPKVLAERYEKIGTSLGMNCSVQMGGYAYCLQISGKSPRFIDFLIEENVRNRSDETKFDPVKHKDAKSFLNMNRDGRFSIPIIKAYIVEKMQNEKISSS